MYAHFQSVRKGSLMVRFLNFVISCKDIKILTAVLSVVCLLYDIIQLDSLSRHVLKIYFFFSGHYKDSLLQYFLNFFRKDILRCLQVNYLLINPVSLLKKKRSARRKKSNDTSSLFAIFIQCSEIKWYLP